MEIEYSSEVRGKVFAYRFSKSERKHIAAGLKPIVKKLERKVTAIENNPKNEGQATYACRIDELRYEINDLQEIITEFEKD